MPGEKTTIAESSGNDLLKLGDYLEELLASTEPYADDRTIRIELKLSVAEARRLREALQFAFAAMAGPVQ